MENSQEEEKGVENPALEIEDVSGGQTPEIENGQNGSIHREPSKHARFKIINHSQSAPNLVDQAKTSENGVGNDDVNVEVMDSLPVPQSGNMKRRNESESHHNTHHSTQGFTTIGYSTTEAVPMTVFYRNEDSLSNVCKQRPTLQELHKGKDAKRTKVSVFPPIIDFYP